MYIFKKIAPILIIVLTVGVFYLPLTKAFFQQDEWLAFARHLTLANASLSEVFQNAFWATGAHYVPLNFLTVHLTFRWFGLNYNYYLYLSIVLHLVNVYLVYRLALTVMGGYLRSLATALLFGLMYAGLQATAWVVADISVHLATLFGLLSLIFFFEFRLKGQLKLFFAALLFLLVSLLFKEIAAGLLPFYLLVMLASLKLPWKKNISPIVVLILLAALYALFRLALLSSQGPDFYRSYDPHSQTTKNEVDYSTRAIIINLALYPLNSVGQILVPTPVLLETAKALASFMPDYITAEKGTPQYDLFILKRVFFGVNIFVFIMSIFLTVLVLFSSYDRKSKQVIFFSYLFILLNSLIYAISPEKTSATFVTESRNLYFPGIAGAILIITFCSLFTKSRRNLVILLFFVIVGNAYFLQRGISNFIEIGEERRNIIQTIHSQYPSLSRKTVFYTESDSLFYGLPSYIRVLPFQSGFGQTLLVWYDLTEDFPSEFFKDRFLWEITDQGYKEFDGVGFGYFRDFDLLAKSLEEKDPQSFSIIAYRYDSEEKKVFDISHEIRGRIEGYLAKKKDIDLKVNAFVSASDNYFDAPLVADGLRSTLWDSQLPYVYRQFFEVKFFRDFRVAQIRLDTYNNKDQNAVGFKVLTSSDGKGWKESFYSKRYPPGKEGIIDLYIAPTNVRYIKIEQIGVHNYASWVIHELNIYEAIN